MVASDAYLARHGIPRGIDDLSRHKCLHYRSPNTGKVEAWHLGDEDEMKLPASLVCNSLEARKHFALKGLGIAYLPDISIAMELRERRLTPSCRNSIAGTSSSACSGRAGKEKPPVTRRLSISAAESI